MDHPSYHHPHNSHYGQTDQHRDSRAVANSNPLYIGTSNHQNPILVGIGIPPAMFDNIMETINYDMGTSDAPPPTLYPLAADLYSNQASWDSPYHYESSYNPPVNDYSRPATLPPTASHDWNRQSSGLLPRAAGTKFGWRARGEAVTPPPSGVPKTLINRRRQMVLEYNQRVDPDSASGSSGSSLPTSPMPHNRNPPYQISRPGSRAPSQNGSSSLQQLSMMSLNSTIPSTPVPPPPSPTLLQHPNAFENLVPSNYRHVNEDRSLEGTNLQGSLTTVFVNSNVPSMVQSSNREDHLENLKYFPKDTEEHRNLRIAMADVMVSEWKIRNEIEPTIEDLLQFTTSVVGEKSICKIYCLLYHNNKKCNKSWTRVERALSHIRKTIDLRPYICEAVDCNCGMRFFSEDTLQQHYKNHSQVPCKGCGSLITPRNMRRHWNLNCSKSLCTTTS